MRCPQSVVVCAAAVLLANTGCMLGSRAVRVSQGQYNSAIQQTVSEQLLLNLVRLHYRDPALFTQVTSVSTQFEIE